MRQATSDSPIRCDIKRSTSYLALPAMTYGYLLRSRGGAYKWSSDKPIRLGPDGSNPTASYSHAFENWDPQFGECSDDFGGIRQYILRGPQL
jgi:hypothetical protein